MAQFLLNEVVATGVWYRDTEGGLPAKGGGGHTIGKCPLSPPPAPHTHTLFALKIKCPFNTLVKTSHLKKNLTHPKRCQQLWGSTMGELTVFPHTVFPLAGEGGASPTLSSTSSDTPNPTPPLHFLNCSILKADFCFLFA